MQGNQSSVGMGTDRQVVNISQLWQPLQLDPNPLQWPCLSFGLFEGSKFLSPDDCAIQVIRSQARV